MEQNAMLRGLEAAVASKILDHGELVVLPLRQQLYVPRAAHSRGVLPAGLRLVDRDANGGRQSNRISNALFREISSTSSIFRQLLDRYLRAYGNMLGQLAACNRLHFVYERCARWLLMTRDRVNSDKIPLTHEYLAMMLGTGRSGVTIAAGTLQKAGFIHCTQVYSGEGDGAPFTIRLPRAVA